MRFLLLSVLAVSWNAFADHHEDKEKMFAEHKSKMISHLDERIAELTKAKGCFNAATKHDDMKKCRDEMKTGMQEIKHEAQEDRKEMRANREELRQKKLDEKIKKLEEKKKTP
jgi:hypothetical protein